MVSDGNGRRRRLGGLMLLAALAMLVTGQTILKTRLKDLGFLVYWLVCFLCTGTALLVAYFDALAVRRRIHREARELLQTTLSEIERDAKKRPRRGGRGSN